MLTVKEADEIVATHKHPQVTEEHVNAVIDNAVYWVPEGTTLTMCLVTLKNGFTVTGESACASPANFKKDVGETYALRSAKQKIYSLLAYELRTALSGKNPTFAIVGTQPEETFLDRLHKEISELNERWEKLSLFISSPGFKDKIKDAGEQEDLFLQYRYMTDYRDVLLRRLARHQ